MGSVSTGTTNSWDFFGRDEMFSHDELQLLWMMAGVVVIATAYVLVKRDLGKGDKNIIFVDIAYFGLSCLLMLIPFAFVRMLILGAFDLAPDVVHPFLDGMLLAVVTAAFREIWNGRSRHKQAKLKQKSLVLDSRRA